MTKPIVPELPSLSNKTTFLTLAQGFFVWLTTTFVDWVDATAVTINAQAIAMTLNSTNDISASSVLIGTGSKTFTVSAGKSYVKGMWLTIADTINIGNSMVGQVLSYSGTTLVVDVPAYGVFGSGTQNSWAIALTAAPCVDVNAAIAANSLEEATSTEVATGTNKVVTADNLLVALEQGINAAAVRLGSLVTGLFGFNRTNTSIEVEYSGGSVYRLVQFYREITGGSPVPAQFVVGASSDATPVAISMGGKDKFGQVNDAPNVSDGTIYWYYTAGNYVEAFGIVSVPAGSAGKVVNIPSMPNILLCTATVQNSVGNATGVLAIAANRAGANQILLTHADASTQQVSWRATGKF